nr:hypothetical protein [Rickettsia rhipicephali]
MSGILGSGKSTLTALLLKNFKARIGDIIIDNQSLYDTSSDSLGADIINSSRYYAFSSLSR